MKNFALLLLCVSVFEYKTLSQGCVAIRNIGGLSPDLFFENIDQKDKLVFGLTSRYFKAEKSYKEDKFFSDTLVTNKIYALNLSVLVLFKKGWSVGVSIPVAANSRRNGADHNGPLSYPKYTTSAFGVGDLRLTIYKWLLSSDVKRKGNIQVALGLKLPTGDYKYTDYFHRKTSTGQDTALLAPVDQAIQPGDGGTGIVTEVNAYFSVARNINLYGQFFYLINPREQNGVSNLKGRNATAVQVNNKTTVMSVPDQFNLRGGINYQFYHAIINAGIRYENVPANDLFGGNDGFRRVASISSVEIGLAYKMKNAIVFISSGIPFKCNVALNAKNDMTPAAFADVIWLGGIQFKL